MSDCPENGFFNDSGKLKGKCPDDAVCIDVMRVYDSCGSKDCCEDLTVLFTSAGQQVVNKATNVKTRSVTTLNVNVSLEPVPFHRGYYTVDMTFYFGVSLDVYLNPCAMPVPVNGLAIFNKQVVLYGSEGNVRIYSSDAPHGCDECHGDPTRNIPKANVQTAEPIGLSAKLVKVCDCCKPCCQVPESISERFGGELGEGPVEQGVLVTIGLFTIVQIVRNVQMLVPAYDFCVPCKTCTPSSENPCELFSRIDFPTDEFFPVGSFGCRCDNQNSPAAPCD